MVKPLFIFFAFIICFDQHIEKEMLLSYPSVRYFWGEKLSPVESSISAPILFRRTASCLKGFRIPPQHHEIAEGKGSLVEGAEKQQQTDRKQESRSSRLLRQRAAATCSHSQPFPAKVKQTVNTRQSTPKARLTVQTNVSRPRTSADTKENSTNPLCLVSKA